MLKRVLIGCGAVLLGVVAMMPVDAQEVVTLALRDGQRPSGELVDLNAGGFTLRVNGKDQQFPVNQVATVEFVVATPSSATQARIDTGHPLVVLRSGEVIEGRLTDVGGTRPLRLTVDTATGTRTFTSSSVAQVHLSTMNSAAAAAQTATPAGAIVVQGNQAWTDSGMSVARGERITFAATGDIMIAADASSGVGGSMGVTNPKVRYPVAKSPVGALIARIGNGVPFAIGTNTEPIMMLSAGQLFLGPNDDHFGDNSGTYVVTMTRLNR